VTATPALTVPLPRWVSLHPAAEALCAGQLVLPPAGGPSSPRLVSLADALAATNRRWGNPVDDELQRWLAGADAVVTGQQPGVWGGPQLTLHKAAAVAAEVRQRRAAGRDAVGFLWLATGDDDLAEMGWGRVVLGGEIVEVREEEWRRGGGLGGVATLGEAAARTLGAAGGAPGSLVSAEVLELARHCYRPGHALGEATGEFLARLLAGLGVVVVDALEAEVARAAAPAVANVLERLTEAWDALADGGQAMAARGWPVPLDLDRRRLPLYRRRDGHRERLAADGAGCPAEVLTELRLDPACFLPNVWLRSLVQDAALGSAVVLLGGAELAYHLQAAGVWELASVARPQWRLRPHVTVLTGSERRLAVQLGLEPADLLPARLPHRLIGGRGTRRALTRLRSSLDGHLTKLDEAVAGELPGLRGDVDATRKRLLSGVDWLADRAEKAATRAAEVDVQRWEKLRMFVRPLDRPQERVLSALAPLLRLGLDWPRQLAAVLDPADPGMHLLFWGEGGAW